MTLQPPNKNKLHLTVNQIVQIKYQLRVYGYVLLEIEDVNLCSIIHAAGGKIAMQSKGGSI